MRIDVKNVSYVYEDGSRSLNHVFLTVEKGELVGLMGQTGSGKTTLLRLMAGLEKPTEGEICIDGQNIYARGMDQTALRKRIGVVFQYPEYQLFANTVREDVGYALKQFRMDRREERVQKALERMGFSYDAIKDQSPFALSGGEKRRVAIAGALVTEPEFLIFDEPLAGLDPVGRKDFLKLLRELKAQGVTVLMISHCVDAVASCADRIVVLQRGEKAFDGAPAQLFADAILAERLHVGNTAAGRTAALLRKKGKLGDEVIYTPTQLVRAVAAAVRGGESG